MEISNSHRSSDSALPRVLAVCSALAGCAILGIAAYMLEMARHPSADPHGGALIFLPALLLCLLGAAFLLVAIGVWRRSHGWQLLLAVGFALVLLSALAMLEVK
jgi:peptidoglycan biosynthesis protein MviN/MurJ (putative lipid II flippase)